MNISSFYRPIALFKETVLPSLPILNKKILSVVLTAFACLSALFLLRKYSLKKKVIYQSNIPNPNTTPINSSKNDAISKFNVLNIKLIRDLSESEADLSNPRSFSAKNTGMINVILPYTFTQGLQQLKELNNLLQRLVDKANSPDPLCSALAYRALTRPNHYDLNAKKFTGKGSFPQNTPLCLLVKGGNLEGCQIILPVYQKEDLLFTTPRNNSVLHIAIATGQMQLAMAIMRRAEALGILNKLLEIKNDKQMTADDLLALFQGNSLCLKNFSETIENYLGQELDKSWIALNTPTGYIARDRICKELNDTIFKKAPIKDIHGIKDETLIDLLIY